jgi:soluble lytic murein transglycosylase-like protein
VTLFIARSLLETALLLAVALGLFAGAVALCERLGGVQAARPWLRVGYALFLAALVMPLAVRWLAPPAPLFTPPMQVWSGMSGGNAHFGLALTGSGGGSAPGAVRGAPFVGETGIAALAALLLAATGLGLLHLGRGTLRLRRLCAGLVPFRQIGRVSLCVSEDARVPFSAWTGRHAYVVLPAPFLLEPARLRLAVAHELQHLRARDTGWAYVAALGPALFPWHPAAHAWVRLLSRLQELACDQRLARRRSVSPRDYGECLIWAAELGTGSSPAPAVVVPMLDGSGPFLERRVRRLLAPSRRLGRAAALPAAVLSVVVMAAVATVSHGAVSDRRISASQAQAVAARVAERGGLRITVDDTVLAEIDRVVATAESRAAFAAGLQRMVPYRQPMEAALARYGVPVELLAIPQAESRFRILPEANTRLRSAGIWQFIPQTARGFGLRVDGDVDERLDPAREVEAAAAFLAQSYAEFKDWPLAIAAYNSGPPRLRMVIARAGTRDTGELVRRGALNPYVSAVLAAVLLMNAPEWLQ